MFCHVEEMKQTIKEALKGIKVDEFKNCFKKWKKIPNWCIASNGEYFGDD